MKKALFSALRATLCVFLVLAVVAPAFFVYPKPVAAASEPEATQLPVIPAANDGSASTGRLIVRLKDGVKVPRESESPGPSRTPLGLLAVANVTAIPYAQGYFLADGIDEIAELIAAGLVEYAVPDADLELLGSGGGFPPDDPRLGDQWHLDLIQASHAWEKGLTGQGVKVAVIDSGVYRDHEDFDYTKISGYSFLGLPEHSQSYDDRTGHGTFVTGLAAAEMGNGKGIAGIASGADILSLRCFSDSDEGDYNAGSGTLAAVLSAIGYAMDQHVDVINMSFGGANEAALLPMREKLQEAADQGIILVAAAGNSGTAALVYPAAYDFVIGVGMVDSTGTVDVRSQRNESVFVTAPGSGVLSLGYLSPQAYSSGTGTSYAAPMVSAMAAIVKQANRAIDNEGFQELLRLSAADKGPAGYDTSYGWGLVNMANLVDLLSQPFRITYECGGGNLSGEPGLDYIADYTIDQAHAAELPSPEREGFFFGGWFDNPAFSGSRVECVPSDSVGDVVFYAKWIAESDIAMSGISVMGIPAAVCEEDPTGMTYVAEIPKGTNLDSLAAHNIVAVPANGAPVEIAPVPESGGARWTVFFSTVSGDPVTYVLVIQVSDNAAPWVAESQETQFGSAIPASYDGKTEAVPYSESVFGWFEDDGDKGDGGDGFGGATGGDGAGSEGEERGGSHGAGGFLTYEVSSNSGSGLAEVVGADVVYTASAADADSTVVIALFAYDGQFRSTGGVTVSIAVGSIPVSDSAIWPVSAVFHKQTGAHLGIPVTLKLYGNSLVSVWDADFALEAETDYTFSGMPAIEGGEGLVLLSPQYLSALEEGIHTIFFGFSAGRGEAAKTVTLELTVVGAPKYAVVFMDGPTEYHRVSEVSEGDTVALPTAPTRSGHSFRGWFTEVGGKGVELTAMTPVSDALGPVDNSVIVHAFWVPQGGDQGGGGSPSGPSIPPGSGDPPGEPGSSTPSEPPSEPLLEPLWTNPFSDVQHDSWFYKDVEYVSSRGLFQGVSADAFRPDSTMTRAMLVTVIHRMAGSPVGVGDSFGDVPPGSWYRDAVVWAQGEGIVTGSESSFNPEDSVTREQMAAILHRYFAASDSLAASSGVDLSQFADAGKISPWAQHAVEWAVEAGLIQGKPGGLLDPAGFATRAEVAAVIHRFCLLQPGEQD